MRAKNDVEQGDTRKHWVADHHYDGMTISYMAINYMTANFLIPCDVI